MRCVKYDPSVTSVDDRFDVSDDITGCDVCVPDTTGAIEEAPIEVPEVAEKALKEQETHEKELPAMLKPGAEDEEERSGLLSSADEAQKPRQTGGGKTRRYKPPRSESLTKLLDLLAKIKQTQLSQLPKYHMEDVLKERNDRRAKRRKLA
jgi:hypothetical protein